MSETRNDAVQLVRDALAWHEYGSQDERRAKALPALDRIEAVVKAARAVKRGAPVTVLDEPLSALDSTEAPPEEEG